MKTWNKVVIFLGFILLCAGLDDGQGGNGGFVAGAIAIAGGSIALSICYHKDGPSSSLDDYKKQSKNRPSDF